MVFFAFVFFKKNVFFFSKKTWSKKNVFFLKSFVVSGVTNCAVLFDGFWILSINFLC